MPAPLEEHAHVSRAHCVLVVAVLYECLPVRAGRARRGHEAGARWQALNRQLGDPGVAALLAL